MSISSERFGSDGHFQQYDPVRRRVSPRVVTMQLNCRACGYQPNDDAILPPRVCPKCNGSAWERIPRPGSILELVDED